MGDATPAPWTIIESLHHALPDAKVILRAHRLSWRKEPALPALGVHGVLVTRRVSPFNLRREFAATSETVAGPEGAALESASAEH